MSSRGKALIHSESLTDDQTIVWNHMAKQDIFCESMADVTVGLEDEPFKAHVQTGDRIKKGQLLLEFDIPAIKAAGCPTITSLK